MQSVLTASLKTTPFHTMAQRLGAQMTSWAGYRIPARFSDPLTEYQAVRERAGVFDFSPLPKLELIGPDALALAQLLVTRDLSRMRDGQVYYAPMCDEDGGLVDNCTVFRFDPWRVRLVSDNAADLVAIRGLARQCELQVRATDVTAQVTNLAVQGPASRDVLRALVGPSIDELKFFWFTQATIAGAPVTLSRTGFTGELGYEVFVAREDAGPVWEALLRAGDGAEITPCGLLSLDVLRIEYGLLFYGRDMDRTNNPFELGLGALVALDGPDFTGKEALRAIAARGVGRRLVGLEIAAPAGVDGGGVLDKRGAAIGGITSGAYSPVLRKSLALAFVPPCMAGLGQRVAVAADDGSHYSAVVARLPFYDPEKRRIRA